LLGDPPSGLGLVKRLDDGKPGGDVWCLGAFHDGGSVVALEVGGLGKNKVGVIRLVHRKDVDHHHQFELPNRLERLLALGNAFENILPVNYPALDRVWLSGDGCFDESVGHPLFFRRQRKSSAGAICASTGGDREGWYLEFAAPEGCGQENSAFAPPASSQRRQNRHSARALSVIAVPRDMTPRMQRDRRPCLPHRSAGLADFRGGQFSDRFSPLRSELADVSLQLGKPDRVLCDVIFIVDSFADEYIHPSEQ